ncbi:MAG: hypothetical protein ACK41G_10280 [Candidatus Thermochlorobacter sp.]
MQQKASPLAGRDILSSLDELPKINLSAWKEKFSKLVEETPYRPKVAPIKPVADASEVEVATTPEPSQPNEFEKDWQGQWTAFLQSLEEDGHARLASHLRLCTVVSAEKKTLKLTCTSRIAYETLLDELYIISEKARAFYQTTLFFEISLDKAASSAAKKERSREEQFKSLAERSELVRYLIKEFGAELSY